MAPSARRALLLMRGRFLTSPFIVMVRFALCPLAIYLLLPSCDKFYQAFLSLFFFFFFFSSRAILYLFLRERFFVKDYTSERGRPGNEASPNLQRSFGACCINQDLSGVGAGASGCECSQGQLFYLVQLKFVS